jgi:hypothetical protein
MKRCLWLSAALAAPLLAAVGLTADQRPPEDRADTNVRWKKIVVDRAFHSEGVAVADVNQDGKLDILAGDVWYEGPDFKRMHVLRKGPKIKLKGYEPLGYSQSFCCWADDFNGDGWPDLIVIGFPGEPCHWYENPGKAGGPWKEHVIWHSACNETPQYADLFGTGKRVLIMGFQPRGKEHEGQMAWFAPGKDPTQPWEMYPISEPSTPGKKEIPGTFRYSHGLGVGDVNGDGRLDVICAGGWWEQPEKDTGRPWKFHPADLGPDCADMFVYDLGGGRRDILSTSAHSFGLWWHERAHGKDGSPAFVRHDLFPKYPKMFSESHALHCVDIDGDGLKDLVTGRRWWAHGPKGDPGAGGPAVLYWFRARRGQDGRVTFVPHLIDDDSGVGTQFAVADLNGDGRPDIIISNKKGVFAFLQVGTPAEARKGG